MKDKLAKIFLDGYPVPMLGEPRPPVSRIVRASGERPGRVDVSRLDSATDPGGRLLDQYDIIDRTQTPAAPIYLRSQPRDVPMDDGVGAPDDLDDSSLRTGVPASDRVIDQLGRGPDPRDERTA